MMDLEDGEREALSMLWELGFLSANRPTATTCLGRRSAWRAS